MQRASQATQAWNLDDARRLAAMLARIAACPQPTMARVHGLALGGGVGLACACDIVLAADDARFGLPEARFGILPAVIGPYLVNAIGARQAQRLALTARRIDAHEARRLGLAHEVHPASQLDAAVDAVLAELLANGPQAQREVKALFSQLQPGPVTPEVREYTAQAISRVRIGDEAREGYAAFFGKRTPRWQGGAG
jgi:methylglutaconyl-CoA hydratase